jgi:hypothetical protein
MKPLQEMMYDEDACRAVFMFICESYFNGDEDIKLEVTELGLNEFEITYRSENFTRKVFIDGGGMVDHYWYFLDIDSDEYPPINTENIEDIFKLVDFIRSLGYEPQYEE